jgi:hypothetical protein
MMCGITVAPTIPTARYANPEPCSEGMKPCNAPRAEGPIFSVSYRNPASTTVRSAAIAISKLRKPRRWSPRIPNAITPVISPATSSGIPNRRFRPIAAPRNSATSVAIAIASAWIHIPIVAQRGKCARHCSGSDLPVTAPSFADRYWTSIAIRLAASTTHRSM